MFIIALDQALANTGWVVLEVKPRNKKRKIKVVEHGLLKTKAEDPRAVRIQQICNFVLEKDCQYQPDMIFIEEVFCAGSKSHFWKHLVVVEGCLEYAFLENKVPYQSISPRINAPFSWRKTLGITKRDKKLSKAVIGNPKISEHEADAFCIGLAGILLNNYVKIDNIKYSLGDYLDGVKRQLK